MKRLKTKDEVREAKKQLTKDVNKFGNLLNRKYPAAIAAEAEIVLNEVEENIISSKELEGWSWGQANDFCNNDPETILIWKFRFTPSYYMQIVEQIELLPKIKKYTKLYKLVKDAIKLFTKQAKLLKKTAEHIESEIIKNSGNTAQQFIASACKSKEMSKEKAIDFNNYSQSLKNWKAAVVENGHMTINSIPQENGNMCGTKLLVGIMVGRGNRIHKMWIEAIKGIWSFDRKKDEMVYHPDHEWIKIQNNTQWQKSDLLILDHVDNIPNELFSEI